MRSAAFMDRFGYQSLSLTSVASAQEQAPAFTWLFPGSTTGVPHKGRRRRSAERVLNLVLRVALPLNARLLPKTRQAIAGYLEEAGPSSETIHDVILAVDEACANVIRHAFPG